MFFIDEKVCLKRKFINWHCVIDFFGQADAKFKQIFLLGNTLKFETALLPEGFIESIKILVEFKRAHYAGISEFHLRTETFGFSNKFFKI